MSETNNVQQGRMDAFAYLTNLRGIISSIAPDSRELDTIDAHIERLKSRKYTVAVIGEFNRGKSSLINALLGMSVLPTDIVPTTATVNRVVYSDVPCAHLKLKSGETREIPFTALGEYVTKLTDSAQNAAMLVDEAIIGYPTPFCKGNISILDTPGLNDNETMDALTLSRMAEADAIIFVISALSPFSQSEARVVMDILKHPGIQHILFTVGFIDKIAPGDRSRLLESIQMRIKKFCSATADGLAQTAENGDFERRRRIVLEAPVLGVSAKGALDAFIDGNAEELEASNIGQYKQELLMRLTSQQDEWLTEEVIPYLSSASQVFEQVAATELETTDTTISAAETALEEADIHMTAIRELKTEAEKELAQFMQQGSAAVNSVQTRLKDAILSEPVTEQTDEKTNESSLVNEYFAHDASQSGFAAKVLGWVKGKAKETGFFREKQDAGARQLLSGYEHAKDISVEELLPEAASRAAATEEKRRLALKKEASQLWNALERTAEALKIERTEEPLELSHCADASALLKMKLEQLCDKADKDIRAQSAGAINVGAKDAVAGRLAGQLSRLLTEYEINAASNAAQTLATAADSAAAAATMLKNEMTGPLEALRAKRKNLQEQISYARGIMERMKTGDA